VWNRGVAQRDVFFSDNDRVEFGQQLGLMHQRFNVEIHAYCLMSNHYHLLLHCPDSNLSTAMKGLASNYTRHVNDRVGRDGPLFAGRFKSRLVLSHNYIAGLARYIHRNALDLPGVSAVDGYRWSSHRSYLGARAEPPWLFTNHVLGYFGANRQSFHQFVSQPDVDSGDRVTPSDIEALTAAAELVADRTDSSRVGTARLARTLVVLIIDAVPLDHQPPLAAQLGITSRRGFNVAKSRARAALRDHPELRTLASTVRNLALPPTMPVAIGV
jgi:REP element-mobilizing transposase RayT